MCGFAGAVSYGDAEFPVQPLDERFGALLQHRGPDGTHYLHQPHFSTVHARLAIIDPDPRANQPMQSTCKRYTLLYNGEIYNYRSLRDELIDSGCEFRTESDTEVLLHFLIAHGETQLHRLNGCFALAFLDHESKSVLLARDRMGINPLWYTFENGQLLFASELKALPMRSRRKLNHHTIEAYLNFSYNPGNDAILQDVHRLPPGCYLKYPHQKEPQNWFSLLEQRSQRAKCTTNIKQLKPLLNEAVASRLIADVPVGCFLSGGIDSSIVAALAIRHKADLNTFSVGFSDQPGFDEQNEAAIVANHIGSEHHCFDLTSDLFAEHAERFLDAIDEPFADSSGIAVGFLASHTSQHVKVALSGDGADELFGGYRKHRAHALATSRKLLKANALLNKTGRLLSKNSKVRAIMKFTAALPLSPLERYLLWARFNSPETVEAVFPHQQFSKSTEHHLKKVFDAVNERDAVLLADQMMVLPCDMLTKVDIMSMRYGLEVRVPFLDPAVVELANALNADQKYNSRKGKLPLRQWFSDLLPESTFRRAKKGFEVPLHWLLTHPQASAVQALIKSPVLHEVGFDMHAIEDVITQFQRGNKENTTLVWTLLVLNHWLVKHHASIAGNSEKTS